MRYSYSAGPDGPGETYSVTTDDGNVLALFKCRDSAKAFAAAMNDGENVYAGDRDEHGNCRVTRNGRRLPMWLSLRCHSPNGFEWGYEGSGPAQLALAILASEFNPIFALRHYQEFKRQVIAGFDRETTTHWQLTGRDLREWAKRQYKVVNNG